MGRAVDGRESRAIEECGCAVAPLVLFALFWLLADSRLRPNASGHAAIDGQDKMGVKERRARHHAAIEQRILETAEELLLRSGSHGVSLRAVAERIEYSPAAIYGYFPTKDDLLAALAAHGFRQLNDALTRVSEVTDSSSLARLREFYWRYYEFSKTHAPYYELMFLDASYAGDWWDREGLELLSAARADADRFIAGCVGAGTFLSRTSVTGVRRTLWAAVHGAAVIALRKRLPADTDRDQLAAAALDAVLYGLTCISTRTLHACIQTSKGSPRILA